MPRPRSFHDPDILTRAMLVFWQQGFHGSNVRDLEQATGLRMSSLYHRFGNKEKLFHEVLDHYLDKVVGWRVRRFLLDSEDPLAGIALFLRTCYDYIDLDAERLPMACLLSNSALELGRDDAGVRQRITTGLARVEQGFANALTRAHAAGRLADVDIALLARQLALGLQGLLIQTKVNPDRPALEQTTRALLALIPERH